MKTRFASAALAGAILILAGCVGAGTPGPGAAPAVEAPPPPPRRDAAAEAFAARKARDFARAEAIASAEIDAGRGHARLYFERGVARMELGKKEEALADFRRLNAIQEDPSALLLAGSIELQLSRWEDAEKDFARSVALAPTNARAWASLAQARIALRELPAAATAHQKAAALAPDDAYVREVGERLARAQQPPVATPEAVPAASNGSAPRKP